MSGGEVSDVKRGFIFANYFPSNIDSSNDAIVVKEILVKASTGETRRNLRIIENYQRPFYTTKMEYRDHSDKKEYESFDRLDTHHCNQASLARRAYSAIHRTPPVGHVRLTQVADSPYLYGTNISPTALLGADYIRKWGDVEFEQSLAIMDYEWDVIHGHGMIVAGTITFKDTVHIAVTRGFLGISDRQDEEAIKRVTENLQQYLGEYITSRKIVPIVTLCRSAAEVVISLFKTAHRLQPDVLGFWNIKGDIGKILEALKAEGVDPANVFSDPKVPREYRSFSWIEDKEIKQKSDNTTTKKHMIDLWHKLIAPSSFQCVCLMALFRIVRARDQLRGSYALDSILHDYLQLGKLKFKMLSSRLSQLEWHKAMQKQYPYEYMAYLAFDGISCELLDEKTKDVANSLRGILGTTEISVMKSNPTQLGYDMHFELAAQNRAICAVNGNMSDELDAYTPSPRKWIVALSAESTHGQGAFLIREYPNLETNLITHSFDLDVEGAYPTTEVELNSSKSTCLMEGCDIQGKPQSVFRELGINLSAPKTNCLSLAKIIYDFPDLDPLLVAFKQKKNIA